MIVIMIFGSLALKIGSYLQVPRNGNSMVAAIRKFFDIKCEEFPTDPFFPNRYMKRWLCGLVLKHHKAILDKYKLFFREMYGSGRTDVPVGPYTFKQYCQSILGPDFFGDEIILFALSLETKLKIMVVLHPSLVLYSITQMYNLRTADIVLVYDGKNQFTPAGTIHICYRYLFFCHF